MSKLQDFLNTNILAGTDKEVLVSDRFKDADGNIMTFKIRIMDNSEYKEYQKLVTKIGKKGKIEVDGSALQEKIVIGQTVDPNFKDAESIKAVGCMTPEQYLSKVLLPGEIVILAGKILEASGFAQDIEELIEEAKN